MHSPRLQRPSDLNSFSQSVQIVPPGGCCYGKTTTNTLLMCCMQGIPEIALERCTHMMQLAPCKTIRYPTFLRRSRRRWCWRAARTIMGHPTLFIQNTSPGKVLFLNKHHAGFFMQGAPEVVLARCTHMVSNSGGAPIPLNDASRQKVLHQVEQLGASQALRCLALASKTVPAQHRQVRRSWGADAAYPAEQSTA